MEGFIVTETWRDIQGNLDSEYDPTPLWGK